MLSRSVWLPASPIMPKSTALAGVFRTWESRAGALQAKTRAAPARDFSEALVRSIDNPPQLPQAQVTAAEFKNDQSGLTARPYRLLSSFISIPSALIQHGGNPHSCIVNPPSAADPAPDWDWLPRGSSITRDVSKVSRVGRLFRRPA